MNSEIVATETALGRLTPVDPRQVWPSESGDFTPWLAHPQNLKVLGDTVGLDLEVEAQEKYVGPFRADLLCKDLRTGRWILIENQLERTDHTHLGQLLVYASGLKAVTLIWIAKQFTEEHRATLDWLNSVTNDEFQFFGLEIELWRIGSSAPAPKFNVISKPNNWSRGVNRAAGRIEAGELSDAQKTQQAFWAGFTEFLTGHGHELRPETHREQYLVSFDLGHPGFILHAYALWRGRAIGVNLVIRGISARQYFAYLKTDRNAIESEIGMKLEWLEPPKEREYQIYTGRHPADLTQGERWPEYYKWIEESVDSYYRAFGQRVRLLRPEQSTPAVKGLDSVEPSLEGSIAAG